MFKYHSDMGYCFSEVEVKKKGKKKKKNFFITFNQTYGIGKKGSYFQLELGPKFHP